MTSTTLAQPAATSGPTLTDAAHDFDARALRDISALLTAAPNPEACWPQVATRLAALFDAQECAITAPGSALGQTAGTFLPRVDAPDDGSGSALCAPIQRDARIVAVIRISGPRRESRFTAIDRAHLDLAALVIEKSLQVMRLKQVLNSRLAQIALAQNTDSAIGDVVLNTAQCPAEMVRIIAKSFYREMTKAGFGSREIINTASEIIAQLSTSLQKHSRRINRKRTPATPGAAG